MNTMTFDHSVATKKAKKAGFSTDAEKLAAMRRHDPLADGHFFCAIATTGIYCYPSCASRPAKVENITFYGSRDEAVRAGYRPCKRCKSDLAPRAEREAAMVADACRIIEGAEEPPLLSELAASAGVSAHHFHRVFKKITGVTPKAYAAAQRQGRVQDNLSNGQNVTEGLYDGFNSSSRFYEASDDMLGMTPTAYKKGGEGEAIWHAIDKCSLGRVLVAATGRGVCAIMLGDDPETLRADLCDRFPNAILSEPAADFADWVTQVVRLVDDPASSDRFRLPLDIRGTAFQRRVWEALREIPAGETASYSEVADRIGAPKAARAVAQACGANNLSVAVPCHRVVRNDGSLSGYSWGIERKQSLLDREQE